MSLPVALQLYSVRDSFSKDAVGTLEKVKEMGYAGVEFAGLYNNDPAALRKELDRLSLKAISAHVSIDQLTGDIDKVIRDYKTLGCEYIAIPWLDAKTMLSEEAFPSTMKTFRGIGEKLTAAGFVMLYHNHNFEFEIRDGKYILDMIYSEIPASLLQTELDTCWVNVGGEDPAKFVLKYTSRAPVVHLKDFVGGGKEGLFELIGKKTEQRAQKADFDFRPVGYGVQDIPAILDASVKAGAKWVVVEQDNSTERDPLDAAKMSRDYLKKLGW